VEVIKKRILTHKLNSRSKDPSPTCRFMANEQNHLPAGLPIPANAQLPKSCVGHYVVPDQSTNTVSQQAGIWQLVG
jgi:hypothetical protein